MSILRCRRRYMLSNVSQWALLALMPPLPIAAYNRVIAGAAKQLPVRWVC